MNERCPGQDDKLRPTPVCADAAMVQRVVFKTALPVAASVVEVASVPLCVCAGACVLLSEAS
jgi:hypothetical protein